PTKTSSVGGFKSQCQSSKIQKHQADDEKQPKRMPLHRRKFYDISSRLFNEIALQGLFALVSIERRGMRTKGVRDEFHFFKAHDRVDQGVRTRVIKKETSFLFQESFQSAAFSESDHRTAGRHGFYRHNSEIFFSRENERARSLIIESQIFIA